MIPDQLIDNLKSKVLSTSSLGVMCYYFINEQQEVIRKTDKSFFSGQIEQAAFLGYSEDYADEVILENIRRRINSPNLRKSLTIFHFLGLSLQDRQNSTNLFDQLLKEKFYKQSVRYKYLIAKVFEHYEQPLKNFLSSQIDITDQFVLILKHLYLELDINKNKAIQYIEKNSEHLDLIDLLLLEDLNSATSTGYNRLHETLFHDILWVASEIQNNHKNHNNDEDQYNSFFRSLINAKGYIAVDQTQRGSSSGNKRAGELDVLISSKENLPLSILEAFKLKSVESNTISKHLKKLSENYDSNGLKQNYAIVYSNNNRFSDLWDRYKKFIPMIDFKHEIENLEFKDITDRFPQFAGIKVGLIKHNNRGTVVQVIHIFMDMSF